MCDFYKQNSGSENKTQKIERKWFWSGGRRSDSERQARWSWFVLSVIAEIIAREVTFCGERGIRTLDVLADILPFQGSALGLYATSPCEKSVQ